RSRNSIGYFRCAAMKNILRVIDVSIKPGTVHHVGGTSRVNNRVSIRSVGMATTK
ncbi:hypothetical protein SAMN04488693_1471, partial [Arthrobacter subterraneus]